MGLRIENDELFYDDEFLGAIEEHYDLDEKIIDYSEDDFLIPEEILGLKENELINNLVLESKRFTVKKINNQASVHLFESYELENWEFSLSPNKFYTKLSSIISKLEGSTQFMDGAIDIFLYKDLEINSVQETMHYLEKQLEYYKKKILKENSVEHTITFTSEHLSAGSLILQYFGKLLQEKYPNEKVSVSIKQEGLKVTMLIETPDGKKEEVEEYLNRYGLVISNHIAPQEFTSNPIQVLELETKLKAAEMEIGFQKQLLVLKDKTYDEKLVSLNDEVKYLREELSVLRKSNDENIKVFLSSLLSKDKLIKKLTKSIDNKNEEETKQLLLELKEKDSKGYISLKEHIDNVIVGNLTNAPSWLEFMITHFPK